MHTQKSITTDIQNQLAAECQEQAGPQGHTVRVNAPISSSSTPFVCIVSAASSGTRKWHKALIRRTSSVFPAPAAPSISTSYGAFSFPAATRAIEPVGRSTVENWRGKLEEADELRCAAPAGMETSSRSRSRGLGQVGSPHAPAPVTCVVCVCGMRLCGQHPQPPPLRALTGSDAAGNAHAAGLGGRHGCLRRTHAMDAGRGSGWSA